ncbi:MAG: serine/threonine-protein kinase, partial [Planctomycetota bacterium]
MSDTAAYQRAKALFLEALERPAAERVAFVQAATDGDAALRDHVLGLLEADEEPAPSVEEAADAAARPEGFGSFRILGFLGEGGMGRVYEAEQDRPRRRVALKVMAPIVGTPAIQRRFEHEAEVLGQLDHPGIARVFDADVTDTPGGPRPWIAMELVAGRPLLDYIQLARPSVEELLDLFARIADSVAHAHRRGIIHRDLKPGNILVQDDGAPKLLDFGVSKLVDEQRTLQTRSGEVLGTLPYVSPEHIARGAGAVDARSDIYALGVMLYEALTGRHPLGIENDTFLDAVAAILQREPRPLGARRPELRGDVELIVATAMHKDPVQRYASVEEFAADVRRYLHHEPIRARPPSAIYKLRRFVQRQRALVVSALSIAVALIVATVVSVEFAIEESRARSAADARVAELEYRDALRVPARVQELLEVGQDELARGLLGEARPDEAIERAYLRHQLLAPQRKVAQFDQDLWRLRRSRDGQRFVAGGKDGIVVLVDAEGRERARWDAGGEVRELDIHPAGDRFAAAVWQPEDQSVALHLWEAGETRVLARAKGHAPPLGHVRFSA